jgi:TrmH family RNA methyltransferase
LRPVNSRQNPLVKDLRRGFSQGELVGGGLCAIEGPRLIDEALRSGLKVHALFVRHSHADDKQVQGIVQQLGKHAEAILLPADAFDSAVATEHSQGVAALVKVREMKSETLLAESDSLLVVLAGIQDPGNLGTILRSAEAFGASGAVLTEGTVSHWNAKAVRASAGSLFRLPVIRGKSDEILARLREGGVRTAATSSRKGTPLEEFDFRGAVAVWIGNEGAGLSRELLRSMDAQLSIPHSEQVESLNAGIAASIVLYEAARQRRQR